MPHFRKSLVSALRQTKLRKNLKRDFIIRMPVDVKDGAQPKVVLRNACGGAAQAHKSVSSTRSSLYFLYNYR